MTPDQIPALIARLALADPRVKRHTEAERIAQVAMWAGILSDVPEDFALQAAYQHYRASQWPIMPADIATRWTSTAKDRLGRHTDPTPAVDPDRVTAWIGELAATRQAVAAGQVDPAPYAVAAGPPLALAELTAGIGRMPPLRDTDAPYLSDQARTELTRAGIRRRPAELAIPCPVPTCKAPAREYCVKPSGKRLAAGTHPSRLDAYLVQQATA